MSTGSNMINYTTHYLKELNFNNEEICMSRIKWEVAV